MSDKQLVKGPASYVPSIEKKDGQPIVPFSNAVVFRRWLKLNHAKHQGIWMQLAKKDSGIASITYAEALTHCARQSSE